MTRILWKLHDRAGRVFAASLCSLFAASLAQSALAAEQGANANDQYTWSAELVSFDQASKTATVKVRMDNPSGNKTVGQLMKGDPITLVWTGITWGAGIRDVLRGQQNEAPPDALTLPAKFVAVDDKDYISFEVPVPDASVAKIQALKAGQWVTATSPKHASDAKQAVVSMRGYNDVPSTTSDPTSSSTSSQTSSSTSSEKSSSTSEQKSSRTSEKSSSTSG